MIFMIIGPRHIAGCSLSIRKPKLMTFTPWAINGTILSLITAGGSSTPIMRGTLGP